MAEKPLNLSLLEPMLAPIVKAAKHEHPYAGASKSGGSATSAEKLDTTTAGSATQPVYFTGGKPVAGTYKLEANVPSGAVFTDTKYTDATTSKAGLMSTADKTKLNGISDGANKVTITYADEVLTITTA